MKNVDALRNFTVLLYFEFSIEELWNGKYKLIMYLAENELPSANFIRVEFLGVANLYVKDFGGGITQILLLTIEDIRDKQLDHINYSVTELERDSISFVCQTFVVREVSEVPE